MNPVNPKGGGGLSVGLVSAGEVKPITPREPVSSTRSVDSTGSNAAAETDSPAAVVSVNPQKVVTGSQQSEGDSQPSDRDAELEEKERKLRQRELQDAKKREEAVRSDTRVSFGQVKGSPGELIFQVKQGDEVVISYPKDQDKSKIEEANLDEQPAEVQPAEEQPDRRLDAVA